MEGKVNCTGLSVNCFQDFFNMRLSLLFAIKSTFTGKGNFQNPTQFPLNEYQTISFLKDTPFFPLDVLVLCINSVAFACRTLGRNCALPVNIFPSNTVYWYRMKSNWLWAQTSVHKFICVFKEVDSIGNFSLNNNWCFIQATGSYFFQVNFYQISVCAFYSYISQTIVLSEPNFFQINSSQRSCNTFEKILSCLIWF